MKLPSKLLRDSGALSLPVGEQIRIDHVDCPMGADTRGRLYIKRTKNCVVAYCHNCGNHGIIPIGSSKVQAISALLQEAVEIEANGSDKVVLPPDCMPFPIGSDAYHWTDKYGIHRNELARFNISYSPSWGRVIIPVYDDEDQLIFWQGRKVDKGMPGPKYISAKTARKPLFYVGHKDGFLRNPLFVVEDALSAIKLGRYTDCVALMGTSGDVNGLCNMVKYNRMVVLLDPDDAGVHKANVLQKRLSLLSIARVWNITSPRLMSGDVQPFPGAGLEPKQMSDTTLRELVLYANGL